MITGAVIQARTSSTRLPGKVLLDLPPGSGVPVLQRVIERVRAAARIDAVIVATSDREDDDPVAAIAASAGVSCFRGPLDDVLARYVGAASRFGLDRIVRITADCPCVDPDIIDAICELQERTGAEYCTNVFPRSWPKGLDVELVTATALARIDALATEPEEREHVLTYAYLVAPDEFLTANYPSPSEMDAPHVRVTLDTPEDYAVLSDIYEHLGPHFRTAELWRYMQENGAQTQASMRHGQ